MNGVIHAVLGTPHSQRRSTLVQASNQSDAKASSSFLLPIEMDCMDLPGTHWEWINEEIKIQNLNEEGIDEWFLFFSNKIGIADQVESLKELIDQKEGLEIGRVLTFLNADYLNDTTKELQDWIDACAHFSDAFCISNRTNQNSRGLSSVLERYKNMRYPLETFILAKSKDPPIDQILCPVARRITHIFDPIDMLDPEESPAEDPFLKRQANGKRVKPLFIPEWKII